jgi:putative phosphoesterase
MKIAIISDTHGHIDSAILGIIRGADLCIHAGDIGNAAVLTQLETEGLPVYAVLGNNDVVTKWPAQDCAFLDKIPYHQTVDLPGGKLCVEHGHRINPVKSRHTKLRKKYQDAKAVIYGHSHRLICDQDAEPWVLNPGSAGRSRTFGGASCIILTISTNHQWKVKPCRITQ